MKLTRIWMNLDENCKETELINQEKFRKDSNIKLEMKKIESKIHKELLLLLKEYNSDFFSVNRERNKVKERLKKNLIKVKRTPFQEFNCKKEGDKMMLERLSICQRTLGNLKPKDNIDNYKNVINNSLKPNKLLFSKTSNINKKSIVIGHKALLSNRNNSNIKSISTSVPLQRRYNLTEKNTNLNTIEDSLENNKYNSRYKNKGVNTSNHFKSKVFSDKNKSNTNFNSLVISENGWDSNVMPTYNNTGKIKFKKLFESNENWYKTIFNHKRLTLTVKHDKFHNPTSLESNYIREKNIRYSMLKFNADKLLIDKKNKGIILNCKRCNTSDVINRNESFKNFIFPLISKKKLFKKEMNKNKKILSIKDIFSILFKDKIEKNNNKHNTDLRKNLTRKNSNELLFPPNELIKLENVYF